MITLSRSEIEALIDYPLAAKAIEAAYRAVSKGRVNLPPVGHIAFPEHQGDCHIKYGHIQGDAIFAIKVATGFAGNADRGLPSGNGMTLVLSAETGEAVALLHDEMVMTDIRTALGGAIASRELARADSKKVLIVGTGIQARRQVEAHIALIGSHLEFTVWGRNSSKAALVANELGEQASTTMVEDLEAACRAADIIVTTTAAISPIIQRTWISPGTHFTAVGADAPGKQELATELVAQADLLAADLAAQCLDHGEFAIPYRKGKLQAESVQDLGAILIAPHLGRSNASQITIADLTGLAAQDLAMTNLVLSAYAAKSTETRD